MTDINASYNITVNRDLHVVGTESDFMLIKKTFAALRFIDVKNAN